MSPTRTEAEIRREILEEEARHATAMDKIEGRFIGPGKPITDHEERLRVLEKWQWRMAGINLCLGVLVTIIVGVCTSTITAGLAQVLERLPTQGAKR